MTDHFVICRLLIGFIVASVFSIISAVSSCDKIRCRYIQSKANAEHKLDVTNDLESHQTSPSFVNDKLCWSYLSSSTVDQSDLDKMLDCAIIDLSGNEIKKIESGFFEKHQQLESLNLDNNLLTFLPEHVFAGLVNLKSLSLRNNSIESLSSDLFKFNLKLEHIDFSNNKLTKVPPSIFSNLSALKLASFHGNPCIDSAFPEVTMSELTDNISRNCGGRDLLAFIISLLKISTHLKNGSLGLHNISQINDQGKNNSTQAEIFPTSTTSPIIKSTSTSDIDVLIISLFWLIIPIILILFSILLAIAFVIYKKYFIYSVNVSRNVL